MDYSEELARQRNQPRDEKCGICGKAICWDEYAVNWASCSDCFDASYAEYLKENTMTFGEYQDGVLNTWNSTQDETARKLNATLGIAGEAGEFADLMKKDIFHGVPADRDKVLKELGDVLYYVTVAAYEHGYTLEQVAVANNKKLAARYPEGFVKGGGIRSDEHATQPRRSELHQAPGESAP